MSSLMTFKSERSRWKAPQTTKINVRGRSRAYMTIRYRRVAWWWKQSSWRSQRQPAISTSPTTRYWASLNAFPKPTSTGISHPRGPWFLIRKITVLVLSAIRRRTSTGASWAFIATLTRSIPYPKSQRRATLMSSKSTRRRFLSQVTTQTAWISSSSCLAARASLDISRAAERINTY